MSKSKYLIILGGSPRGGEHAWKSMNKYVQKHLSADLAICTGKKWISRQSFLNEIKFDWTFDEPDDWSLYYDNNFQLDWKKAFELGRNTGLLESGFIHFAIKDIIYRNYLDIVKNYDYIIYSRFDQLFINYHNHGFGDNILIPEGEDYFGLFDRHILFPADFASNFFGILNYFFDNYEDLSKIDYLNCETLNKLHLETFVSPNQILRSKRFQFTVAESKDRTNWRKAIYKIYFLKDLKIKYPDEFIQSIKNFNLQLKFSKLNYLNLIFLFNYYYLILRIKLGSIKNSIYSK